MPTIQDICAAAPVIPVLQIERLADAAPLARALAAGGLPVLEVTLRTDCALEAIREMRAAAPDAIVGAGTLRRPADVVACLEAGARFGVSPGAPTPLIEAVQAAAFAFLPGCATPTEAMALADRGFEVVKFFPAGAAGGPAMLKALASPLPDIRFCPTGGVTLDNAPAYLSLPNVAAVGGSWVAPKSLIDAGDWPAIESLAREALTRLAPLQARN
jgi:2-dehydro-3-deoxyphosphogluconate aldolase/(4S)-4-hydroxy-2-oxoglutarate aldolase